MKLEIHVLLSAGVPKCNGNPLRIPGITRHRSAARVLSTELVASIVVVVIVIENRAGNDDYGPF